MASKGEFPASSQGPIEVSATHNPGVDNDSEYFFFPEGYPYVGSVAPPPPRESRWPLFPSNYTYLAQLVSGTPSVSSLYHNPIQSSGTMPTSGPLVSYVASQTPVLTVVSSVPIQPTVMVGAINVTIGSQGPPLSRQYVPPTIPPHGGQRPPPSYVRLVSSGP